MIVGYISLLFTFTFTLCVYVFVCLAVDEQNSQTLKFETENAKSDDDDDDDVISSLRAGLLYPASDPVYTAGLASASDPVYTARLAPASDPVYTAGLASPSHIPSSSSGYSSVTPGAALSPEEPCAQPCDTPSIHGGPDIPCLHGGLYMSTTSAGICTEPGRAVCNPAVSITAAAVDGDELTVSTDVIVHDLSPDQHRVSSSSCDCVSVPMSLSPAADVIVPPCSVNIPLITTDLLDSDVSRCSSPVNHSSVGGLLPLTTAGRPVASLAVPRLGLSLDTASSDGDSSFCSTPGNSTPEVLSPGIFSPDSCQSPLFMSLSTFLCLLVCLLVCLCFCFFQ